jgi:hypothetical protein
VLRALVNTLSEEDCTKLPPGCLTYTSPCGGVTVVLDSEHEEWYVEASPLVDPSVIEQYLDGLVFALGYELLDDGEEEPLVLDDGRVRIYCAPAIVAPDDALHDPGSGRLATDGGYVQTGLLAGLTSSLALLLTSPVVAPLSEVLSSC